MTYTHEQLLAAIETEVNSTALHCHDRGHPPGCCCDLAREDHLDLCRVILDLHEPVPVHGYCQTCLYGYGGEPCPTVQVVADALRKMGCDV